jgi:hypothetical protein
MATAVASAHELPADGALARVVGVGFLAALADRDFDGLRALISDDLRARALLPTGPIELEGSDAALDRLRSWFGTVEELTLLEGAAETFANVLHVMYRLALSEHPFRAGTGPQMIEQQLFCRVAHGRIASFDLLCSGFHPQVPAA